MLEAGRLPQAMVWSVSWHSLVSWASSFVVLVVLSLLCLEEPVALPLWRHHRSLQQECSFRQSQPFLTASSAPVVLTCIKLERTSTKGFELSEVMAD